MSVADELKRLGGYRVKVAVRVAQEDDGDGIAASTLLAIGSRETGLRNINSYLDGRDRGCFQISDRYHSGWLATVPGCPVGSWHDEPGKTALDRDYCPQFTTGARKACDLLAGYVEYAIDHGVRPGDRIRVAIAAYNAGPSGALRGYREGNVDAYTTGKDYSADVLKRRVVVQDWLRDRGYVT